MLNFDIHSLTSPGRPPAKVETSLRRALRPEDLMLMATSERAVPVLPLKTLTERHHRLARLLAAGSKPGEAAIICGYEPARVSNLQTSPAFQELIAFYRDIKDQEFASTFEQLAGLAHDATMKLREKLEDPEEDLTIGQLLEIGKFAADRSGLGPSSKTTTEVNVNFASRLDEARRRARQSLSTIIDAEVIPE